ncbi:L,D-transpeptidase family protein [Algoriphagus sp. D3-2-R+10]|uniref:L,D-transpeptidase family protein n=1 Tax=Algoriphagus aurantiacus TaxID=3103948 RepID=UPI002B3836CA|nr:L,D-transpeptidase family protein [Algoriphagus sp. D3-2-R+10]MEB2778012.1 L,D-transpeptidase family protein [Algoriphagus sp. D3-2-R+10]
MNKHLLVLMLLSLAPGLFCFAQSNDLSDNIRIRLELDQPDVPLNVRSNELFAKGEIHQFYTNRTFNPAWTHDGVLSELAYELRFEIIQSEFDGLKPENYHLDLINEFFNQFESNKKQSIPNALDDLADVDLLLSDAFFHLASHLEIGKVNPNNLAGNWHITAKKTKVSYNDLLEVALDSQQIRQSLETLYPSISIYKKGREVIRAMDEIRKQDTLNWKAVKISKTIKVGEKNGGIPNLRERLGFWKYLQPYAYADEKEYDSTMFSAVQNFQQRNGLEPDGALGKNTVNALNQSPADLMDRAAVNMERLRWLPDTLRGAEMILVNIANYQLDYLSNRDTLFTARVIVGMKYHASPIFSSAMSYIVFSPYWNLPTSIVRNEVMPAVRKNPNYLAQKNMEVVTFSGKAVDPTSVNWSGKSIPYMIRQKPGAHNSLGLVKFMFPNEYSVYIHDTPSRSLFTREDRALSHGCIRIQNPADFAALLLKDDPTWTTEKIDQAMHQNREQIVTLNRKIPVVLLYLTFWADSKGQGHFRQDIYDRDEEVLEALRK